MVFRRFILLAGACFLTGCTSIDFDYPRQASYAATDTDDTSLGQELIAADHDYPPEYSGFYPITNGVDSLAARLVLAREAEKTIDSQYYLIKDDIVGRAFINSLLQAADRGVRVRLLIDDMFTSGYDVGLAALDSHPNFEIRIYNPFHRGVAGKAQSALTGLSRINRRMHNKSFTLDNKVTIIGGRNIADEYFGAREDKAFGDMDVAAIGPVVQEVSNLFDLYWNHETALPVLAFVEPLEDPVAELDALRSRLQGANDDIADSDYADAVRWHVYDYLATDETLFEWAPYELVYDSPDKGIKSRSSEAASITEPLAKSIASAKKEVIIVSPYFVPLKSSVEALTGIEARGVEVAIITNSLAANNQFAVHAGYKPSRKPLIEAGVDLYEVRPDAHIEGTEFIDASGATATLHTKAYIVDREQVFIGSFNFDPRSENLNTEMGVIIHDAKLGEFYASELESHYEEFAYVVFQDERGKIRWRGYNDGEEVIFTKEPNTTWWDRFMVGLAGLFPIKSQL
jgi:putative cardiolipin synthase